MNLLVVGCNHRTARLDFRERMALDAKQLPLALKKLKDKHEYEALILSTCNRLELYLARTDDARTLNRNSVVNFLKELHQIEEIQLADHLYDHVGFEAVRHLFRVVAGLDSLVLGEDQIAHQVKDAYELASAQGTAGPILHAIFQRAQQVAKRIRTETGIDRGRVSVASAAVAFVQQVFDNLDDKTILVIGAGKMGELTLRHLRELKPRRILVTNRSPEKARAVAYGCRGEPVPWEQLDDFILQSQIILSTTGAMRPIVTLDRWQKLASRRMSRPIVIFDMAVPRDFDPRIHHGDQVCLFNIDDLQRIREQTLVKRVEALASAETIIERELMDFLKDWARRSHAPTISRLTKSFEDKRDIIVQGLFTKLKGSLTAEDRSYIQGAFRSFQNQFLHNPIKALTEDVPIGGRYGLQDAIGKLFRV